MQTLLKKDNEKVQINFGRRQSELNLHHEMKPTKQYSAVANLSRLWSKFLRPGKFAFSKCQHPTSPMPHQVRPNKHALQNGEPGSRHEIMYMKNKIDGLSQTRQNPHPQKPAEETMKRFHLLSPQ